MNKYLKKFISTIVIVATDIFGIFIAFAVSVALREILSTFIALPVLENSRFEVYFITNWWIIPLYIAVFTTNGLYSKHRPFWQEVKTLASAITLAAILVYASVSLGRFDELFSRVLFLFHPLSLLFILPVLRRFAKSLLFSLGYFRTTALQVQLDTDYSTVETFHRNNFIGYFITKTITASLEKQELTQIVERISQEKQKANAEVIILVAKELANPALSELLERLYFVADHIVLIPELMDVDVVNADVYHFMYENLFVFDITKGLNQPYNRLVKRIIDILLSAIGIIIFSPILLLASLLVFIRDGFPILYNHDRFGKGGKIFTFHKFRTMRNEKYPDENYDLVKKYVASDPVKKELWEKYQKLENDPHDPRILPGMNLLRKTSMDELAQLFNVFKGDMSIVGPRPFMPREREKMGDYFDRVLAAKPGLTDLWTVSGRNSLSFEQRLKMSTWYVQNWSLWLDFVIIAKTVQQVISYFLKWSKHSKKTSTNT